MLKLPSIIGLKNGICFKINLLVVISTLLTTSVIMFCFLVLMTDRSLRFATKENLQNLNMESEDLDNGQYARILVASLLVFRQKLHSFHWEIGGSSFLELHKLFQEQYEEILKFADRVAEYLRTFGSYPPNTLAKILKLSLIDEVDDYLLGPREILENLEHDFGLLARYVEESPNFDRSWASIADDLHEYLKKQQWFVRSYLEG